MDESKLVQAIRMVLDNLRKRFHSVFSNLRMSKDENDIGKEMKESIFKVLKEVIKFTIHCDPRKVPNVLKNELISFSNSIMPLSYTRNILLTRLCEQSGNFSRAIELQKELFLLLPNVSNFQELERYQKKHASTFFSPEVWKTTVFDAFEVVLDKITKDLEKSSNEFIRFNKFPNADTIKVISDKIDLFIYTKGDNLINNAFIIAYGLYPSAKVRMGLKVLEKRDEMYIKIFQALKKYKVDIDGNREVYAVIKDHIIGPTRFISTQHEHLYTHSDMFFNLLTGIAKTGYRSIAYSLLDFTMRSLMERDFEVRYGRSQYPALSLIQWITFIRNMKKIYQICQIDSETWMRDFNIFSTGGLIKNSGAELPYAVCLYLRNNKVIANEIRSGYQKATDEDLEEDVIVMGESEVVFECPILLDTLHDPVKNKVCGHIYSREGATLMIKSINENQESSGMVGLGRGSSAGRSCPMPGCTATMCLENLLDDHETKRKVEMKNMLEVDEENEEKNWVSSSSESDEDDLDDEEEEEEEKKRKRRRQQQDNNDSDEDVLIVESSSSTSNINNSNNNRRRRGRPMQPASRRTLPDGTRILHTNTVRRPPIETVVTSFPNSNNRFHFVRSRGRSRGRGISRGIRRGIRRRVVPPPRPRNTANIEVIVISSDSD